MNWDDARYFLAVARQGQMLGAARRLGVSQALLSRRIAALEAATGVRLLDRTTRGCTLTEAGRTMLDAAERAEAAMQAATAQMRGAQETVAGTVRIGAPDGFGSVFLAPRVKALRAEYPDLQVQLVPMPRSFSLAQREADVAVMIGRPERGRLRVRHLTDYTLSLYASAGYLEAAGRPQTPAELRGHTLVGYVEDLIYTAELQYAQEFLRDWRSDIEVSTAVGQHEVVRSGGGIGILHDFMVAGHDGLERVLPELVVRRSYFTVWHDNQRTAHRVRATVSFLDAAVRGAAGTFVRDPAAGDDAAGN